MASVKPMFAVILILSSTIVSLIPSMISKGIGGTESISNIFGWTFVIATVQIPTAMANVAVQAYLMRAGALLPGAVGRRASAIAIFRNVFYNQVFVLLTVVTLFWVDLLPWFGSSRSIDEAS